MLLLPREDESRVNGVTAGVRGQRRSAALGIRIINIAHGRHGLGVKVRGRASRRTGLAGYGYRAMAGAEHAAPVRRLAREMFLDRRRSSEDMLGRDRALGWRASLSEFEGFVSRRSRVRGDGGGVLAGGRRAAGVLGLAVADGARRCQWRRSKRGDARAAVRRVSGRRDGRVQAGGFSRLIVRRDLSRANVSESRG